MMRILLLLTFGGIAIGGCAGIAVDNLRSRAYYATAQGQLCDAETLLKNALAAAEKGGDQLQYLSLQSDLAGYYYSVGRYPKAKTLYEQALAGWKARPAIDRVISHLHFRLGEVARRSGDILEAERWHREALTMREAARRRDDRSTAAGLDLRLSRWAFIDLAIAEGRYADAVPLIRSATILGHGVCNLPLADALALSNATAEAVVQYRQCADPTQAGLNVYRFRYPGVFFEWIDATGIERQEDRDALLRGVAVLKSVNAERESRALQQIADERAASLVRLRETIKQPVESCRSN